MLSLARWIWPALFAGIDISDPSIKKISSTSFCPNRVFSASSFYSCLSSTLCPVLQEIQCNVQNYIEIQIEMQFFYCGHGIPKDYVVVFLFSPLQKYFILGSPPVSLRSWVLGSLPVRLCSQVLGSPPREERVWCYIKRKEYMWKDFNFKNQKWFEHCICMQVINCEFMLCNGQNFKIVCRFMIESAWAFNFACPFYLLLSSYAIHYPRQPKSMLYKLK